jgi:heptosyltransferase-2
MTEILIVKLGATGDVVRTTPLLSRLGGHVTWVTAAKNAPLLRGIKGNPRCFTWEEREQARDRRYDTVINLEDDLETGRFVKSVQCDRVFGEFLASDDQLAYSEDSRGWFDLSLISRFGRKEADQRKLANRRTYQDLIFSGLGFKFGDDRYLMPEPIETNLRGDVAISAQAGPVWPNKNWAFYAELKKALESRGLVVNYLPVRSSLLEHLCDVRNHRCLVSGDSLPMHLALGVGVRCVTLFTCTSPWEIHGYGLQKKLVSPLLEEFFYTRTFNTKATTAIGLEEVLAAAMEQLEAAPALSAAS